jgi:hypothetical protein
MAADANKSLSITNLDAIPIIPNSRGQGAGGMLTSQDGICPVTAVGIATVGSTYKLARIPTGAIIKSVLIASDVLLDSNATPTLEIDWNLAFSDSTIDGTPSALQGLIPTTANNGSTTTFAAYTAPNIIFGTSRPSLTPVEIVYAGSRTNYPMPTLTQEPVWQNFGFVNGIGNPDDPNGFFDLVARVSTAAATGVAGNLSARIVYVY